MYNLKPKTFLRPIYFIQCLYNLVDVMQFLPSGICIHFLNFDISHQTLNISFVVSVLTSILLATSLVSFPLTKFEESYKHHPHSLLGKVIIESVDNLLREFLIFLLTSQVQLLVVNWNFVLSLILILHIALSLSLITMFGFLCAKIQHFSEIAK